MTSYIITTHPGLPGVGLSRDGRWGNVRHDSAEAAEIAARADAGSDAVEIKHERVRNGR